MKNRVHSLLKPPRPIIRELVCLSEIQFRRLCAYSGFFLEPIEAWTLTVRQPGEETPMIVHVWDSN